MVVGEGSTDGHVDVEAARRSVEDELGGSERVVFMELQQSVVVPSGIRAFKAVEAEVEVEESFASDESLGNRLFIERSLLLH